MKFTFSYFCQSHRGCCRYVRYRGCCDRCGRYDRCYACHPASNNRLRCGRSLAAKSSLQRAGRGCRSVLPERCDGSWEPWPACWEEPRNGLFSAEADCGALGAEGCGSVPDGAGEACCGTSGNREHKLNGCPIQSGWNPSPSNRNSRRPKRRCGSEVPDIRWSKRSRPHGGCTREHIHIPFAQVQ